MIPFQLHNLMLKVLAHHLKLDRNKNGGGIILYTRNYIIASKLTSCTFPNDIEAFFIEKNLKWQQMADFLFI